MADERDDAPEDQDPTEADEDRGWREATGGVRIIGAHEAGDPEGTGDVRPVVRVRGGAEPPNYGAGQIWADDAPQADEADDEALDEARARADEADDLAAEPDDDSYELPHYTDPPTGQVPKVVIGDSDAGAEGWATAGQPRWRDQDHDLTESHDFSDLVDSGPRLGALDDDSSPPFFDPELDLSGGPGGAGVRLPDVDEEPPRRPLRRAPRRIIAPQVADEPATPSVGGRNMPQAVGVGVALVAIGLLCFRLGTVATTALVTVVLTLAAGEFFQVLRRAGYAPALPIGIVAVAALAIAPVAQPDIGHAVVLSLTVLAGLLWFFWVNPAENSVMNLGATLLGVLWIGGLGSMASLALGQGRLMADALGDDASNPGIGVLIAATLVAVSYDIGGYFVGQAIGQRPLSAASPNKTMEGLFGGVAAAIAVPFVIVGLIGVEPVGHELPKTLFFCLFCAIVAPLGDLCQSKIKRDLNVKDMGSVLPGHGGVLDRFDAFLFVLPMAWFMAHLLELGPDRFAF